METKKRRKKIIYLVKLLVQIAFFILLPALYISALSGIQQIYLSIIKGTFTISALWPQTIEAIAIIPVTILFGRFFCGWMCAFGTLGDVIYLASQKIFKTKFRIGERADAVLKSLKYILLAFIIYALWTLGIKTFSTYSPWDVFGIIATVGKAPDFGYVVSSLLPGTVIFVFIVIASFFIERFFCRYLCPLGAVFAIISVLRIAKIKKTREGCGKCMICTKTCSMGIPLYKHDVIRSGECINCFKCIEACPRGNVSYTAAGADLRPVVAGIVAVSVMTGMYYAGSIASAAVAGSGTVVQTTQNTGASSTYKDGTYQGSGTGFRGGTTTVSVIVKSGRITDVQVLSYQDDAQFFIRAESTVINQIISSQSSKVNAVSGATYSSNGIMSAVSGALSQAKI